MFKQYMKRVANARFVSPLILGEHLFKVKQETFIKIVVIYNTTNTKRSLTLQMEDKTRIYL